MKMIPCEKCSSPMPELRLTQFGYNFCVSCSEKYNLVGAKRGMSIQKGEGDHTWTETVIMDEEEYKHHINPDGNPEITFGVENKNK